MTTHDVFQAIAHPVRREILDSLLNEEISASKLAEPFQMSRPAVSQHLRVLREAGLVRERRVGRQRLYRVDPQPLGEVRDWLRSYDAFWQQRLNALGQFLEDRHEGS